ncbi:hypothetical protein HYU15_02245 [Candidatus Woesearchaeota archaeon]|nr:hypothetical protein [Candidatus Woesearchaeota archaeon]
MPRFRVFKTSTYDKDYEKLDHSEQLRADSLIEDLFESGDVVGKPLGTLFFREKKFGGKRLLYLVYKTFSAILLVAITDKKAQQATINETLEQLKEYEDYIKKKLNEII